VYCAGGAGCSAGAHATHDALDGAGAEVVRSALHGEAVHAHHRRLDAGVHERDLADHGHVGHHNEPQQGPQHVDAVVGDDRADEPEHAEGGHQDDAAHDGDAHVRQGVADVDDRLGLLPRGDHAEAEYHGDDDHLQHGGISHGLEEVAREDVHDGVDERRRVSGLVGQIAGVHHVAGAYVHHIGEDEAEGDGKSSSDQVEQNGLTADGPHLLHVVERYDAGDDGEQHQRHDDHLDEVQKDGAEGLDVGVGDIRRTLEGDAGEHAQDERDEDPGSQRQALEPGLVLLVARRAVAEGGIDGGLHGGIVGHNGESFPL